MVPPESLKSDSKWPAHNNQYNHYNTTVTSLKIQNIITDIVHVAGAGMSSPYRIFIYERIACCVFFRPSFHAYKIWKTHQDLRQKHAETKMQINRYISAWNPVTIPIFFTPKPKTSTSECFCYDFFSCNQNVTFLDFACGTKLNLTMKCAKEQLAITPFYLDLRA